MLTSRFASFTTLTQAVLSGKTSPKRLAWFVVYGSGDFEKCNAMIGGLQLQLGSSEKGLRLLDVQLEIHKMLEQPELVAQ